MSTIDISYYTAKMYGYTGYILAVAFKTHRITVRYTHIH